MCLAAKEWRMSNGFLLFPQKLVERKKSKTDSSSVGSEFVGLFALDSEGARRKWRNLAIFGWKSVKKEIKLTNYQTWIISKKAVWFQEGDFLSWICLLQLERWCENDKCWKCHFKSFFCNEKVYQVTTSNSLKNQRLFKLFFLELNTSKLKMKDVSKA